MILVLIFIICIFCSVMSVGSSGVVWYNADINQKKWECIKIGNSKNVVGKINRKGDSECMYMEGTGGCYVITDPKNINGKIDNNKLNKECNNIINNYPVPTVDNKKINLDIYSCGVGSTNEELWNTTGYENKKSACSIILEKKGLLSESEKWLRQSFENII